MQLDAKLDAARFRDYLDCPRKAWFAVREGVGKKNQTFPFAELAFLVKRTQRKTLTEAAASLLEAAETEDFSSLKFENRVEKTARALELPRSSGDKALLGTAFASEPFKSEPDLLVLKGSGGLELYGVTTSTNVKEKHLVDLAWHLRLLRSKSLEPREVGLFRIGKAGSLPEDRLPAPASLLAKEDLLSRVAALAERLGGRIEDFRRENEAASPPEIPARKLPPCWNCPQRKPCGRSLPKHHLKTLHAGAGLAEDLLARGLLEIAEIPEGTKLSKKQKIQVEAVKTNLPWVDLPAIEVFLADLIFPLAFLDFETFGTALPLVPGVASWEPVPFQFSLHLLESWEEEPRARGFLADETEDPRETFLEALIADLPSSGSILVYNRRFEEGVLRRLGERFPAVRGDIEALLPRLRDLLSPFAEFRYYHPDQLGKVSMKKVLPAMTGKGYEGLAVGNGEEANAVFAGLVLLSRQGRLEAGLRGRVRAALETYCGLDTQGMVLMLRELKALARAKGTKEAL